MIPKAMVQDREHPDDRPFPKTYCKLYRIPEDYLEKNYIHRVCPTLSIEALNKLEKNIPSIIRNMFLQPTESTPNDAWPKCCREKDIFFETFKRVHAAERAFGEDYYHQIECEEHRS